MEVAEFYNTLSNEYSELIKRTAPRYEEMLWSIFTYIPGETQPGKILDLGCGTGNLSEAAIKNYPNAELVLLDISQRLKMFE